MIGNNKSVIANWLNYFRDIWLRVGGLLDLTLNKNKKRSTFFIAFYVWLNKCLFELLNVGSSLFGRGALEFEVIGSTWEIKQNERSVNWKEHKWKWGQNWKRRHIKRWWKRRLAAKDLRPSLDEFRREMWAFWFELQLYLGKLWLWEIRWSIQSAFDPA